MEDYKTKINVILNGAGCTYYLKESYEVVKKDFYSMLQISVQNGFAMNLVYQNAMRDGVQIDLLTLNPINCASVEVYENK
jgi:hypothetical protein